MEIWSIIYTANVRYRMSNAKFLTARRITTKYGAIDIFGYMYLGFKELQK